MTIFRILFPSKFKEIESLKEQNENSKSEIENLNFLLKREFDLNPDLQTRLKFCSDQRQKDYEAWQKHK